MEALYALFKGEFSLSHRALSQIILSDCPQPNGLSPRQMVANTSWLSRSIVHAPMDLLQDRYFADFRSSARRVHSHLNQSGISDEEIFRVIGSSDLMPGALSTQDQSSVVYRNALARLWSNSGIGETARARASLLLTITAGCTGNVAKAIDLASGYIYADGRADGRVDGRFTPQPSAADTLAAATGTTQMAPPPNLIGLIRLIDGRVASNPYIIPATDAGAVIGALALGPSAIADVAPDVSAEHLRVWREKGRWLACDLGSTNGTTLLPAGGGSPRLLVSGEAVELHPGDNVRLGSVTTFAVVAVAHGLEGGGETVTSPVLEAPAARGTAAHAVVRATAPAGHAIAPASSTAASPAAPASPTPPQKAGE